MVLPAFGSEPLLTFGSDQREVDYEREWQACVQRVAERKQRSWLRRLGRRTDSTGAQKHCQINSHRCSRMAYLPRLCWQGGITVLGWRPLW